MMKKVYYQLKLTQKSPLRIGNGESEESDSDLMIDGRGFPFIPGSSLAGVLREQYGKMSSVSKNDVDSLFGYIDGEILENSHVIVSDAVVSPDAKEKDFIISIRDGIGIDEWGITITGNKYDFQVVETEKSYYAVLEWTGTEKSYQKEIENGLDPLVKMIVAQGLLLGARTTRGYGSMSVDVRRKKFDFPSEIQTWLMFDPFSADAFSDAESVQAGNENQKNIRIVAELVMKGSFTVRVNTARMEYMEDGSVPDSLPLKNSENKPVIPGTSWAGVFRHHMLALMRQSGLERTKGGKTEALNLLFGKAKKEGEHVRSRIRFNETEITGGKAYSMTRNAVERFTQSPRNTALYTTQLWQGGRGTLEIVVKASEITTLQKQLLATALIDLDLGLMTFGGESGVGRGRCEIEHLTVNGQDKTAELKSQNSHFLEVKA